MYCCIVWLYAQEQCTVLVLCDCAHIMWYICACRFQDLRTQKSKLAQLVKEREEEIG